MTKQTTTDENNIILSIASVNQETLSFINNTVFRKQLYQILIMSMHSQGLWEQKSLQHIKEGRSFPSGKCTKIKGIPGVLLKVRISEFPLEILNQKLWCCDSSR